MAIAVNAPILGLDLSSQLSALMRSSFRNRDEGTVISPYILFNYYSAESLSQPTDTPDAV